MDQQGLRILLIDDDEDDYVITRELLAEAEEHNFTLDWTATYEAGLQEIKRSRHDVYLIDYRLGRHCGLELFREAIEHGCKAPLILLTGQGDRAVDLAAMEAGAADYLVKGQIDAALLERAIRYAVGRARTKKALRQSEQRFRQVISSISDHIYMGDLTDPDRPVSGYISPNVENLTGYPAEKFMADWRFWRDLIHPDDMQMALAQPRQYSSGGHSEVEYRLRRADGRFIWVRDSRQIEVEADSRGRLKQVTVYGVVSDITERKQAKVDLENSIRQLNVAYEQATIYAQELKEEITERKRMEKALEQRAAQLATINEIGRKMAAVLDLDSVLDRAAHLVQEAFGYPHVALFLLDQGLVKLKAVAGSCGAEFPPAFGLKPDQGAIGWVATHGEKVVANDVSREPRYICLGEAHCAMQAELCLPIKAARQILGVLHIQSSRLNAFGENDVVALEILADQVAVVLENARLYAEAQHRTRELAALNKAGRAMASTLDLETVLEQTMAEANALLETERASVLLLDAANDELYFAAVVAHDRDKLLGLRLPLTAGIAGWTIKERQSVLVNDVRRDPRFYDRIDATAGLTTHSMLAVPMIYKDRPIGVVEVINKTNGSFNQYDLETLEALTHSAAIAIENARLYDETRRRAKQLAVLHELDQAITSNLSITNVYHAFALHAARLLPYDRMSITLLEDDNIYLTYVAGEEDAALPMGARFPRKTSATGWVISRGQPLLRHNIATDPRFAEDERLVAGGIQSAMFIPLRTKGQAIGTWNLSSRQIGAYHPDDLRIAQSMADQLAIAIENARLFEEVQLGREQLRRLNRQIVSAQEEERQRLSRELHDEAGQALTALKIGLELTHADLPAEAGPISEGLSEAINLTDMTMEQLRRLARDLRPPALDTAGLNPTLEGLCRDFARRTQLAIDYVSTGLPDLPDTVNICLYRFLQEALTNVAKHARAGQVWVKLGYDAGSVILIVQDNGRGFDQQARLANSEQSQGIGLVGMQERLELLGGQLEINSQPGQGTCLGAQIPIEEAA